MSRKFKLRKKWEILYLVSRVKKNSNPIIIKKAKNYFFFSLSLNDNLEIISHYTKKVFNWNIIFMLVYEDCRWFVNLLLRRDFHTNWPSKTKKKVKNEVNKENKSKNWTDKRTFKQNRVGMFNIRVYMCFVPSIICSCIVISCQSNDRSTENRIFTNHVRFALALPLTNDKVEVFHIHFCCCCSSLNWYSYRWKIHEIITEMILFISLHEFLSI